MTNKCQPRASQEQHEGLGLINLLQNYEPFMGILELSLTVTFIFI